MKRFADTADLPRYLWWLLPVFMKLKGITGRVYALCKVVGDVLTAARSTLVSARDMGVLESSEGEYLDRHLRARQTPREEGESDESAMARGVVAWQTLHEGGTLPGLDAMLERLGFTVAISEPHQGAAIWSRFVVSISGWTGTVDATAAFKMLRKMRPAHTIALLETSLEPVTMDSGNIADEGEVTDGFNPGP